MTPEQSLREALDGIAGLAPDPAALRSRLNARIRAHRQRRTLLITGAAATGAAAVGVPAAILLSRGPTGKPHPSASASSTRVPMLARPTWLPDGLFPIERSAEVGGPEQQLGWASQALLDAYAAEDQQALALAPAASIRLHRTSPPFTYSSPWPSTNGEPLQVPPYLPLGGEPNTTVNGAPAYLDVDNFQRGSIVWQIDGGLLVTASLNPPAGTSRSDAIDMTTHFAQATVLDDYTVVCETSLQFGWLPPDVHGNETISLSALGPLGVLGGQGGPWVQTASFDTMRVDLAPAAIKLLEYGVPATVRGRPALLFSDATSGRLSTTLEDGRWLRVSYNAAESAQPAGSPSPSSSPVYPAGQTAIQIADALIIGPNVDTSWLGP